MEKSVSCFVPLVNISLCHLLLDYEQIVKLSDEFNGADLRNVCTEAG